MLKLNEELQTLVLLQFTRKLIINSNPTIFLDEKERPIKKTKTEKLKEVIKTKIPEPINIPQRTPAPPIRMPPQRPAPVMKSGKMMPSLRIPEMRLPPQFAYLKPGEPRQNANIDLGKLNDLIYDPAVKIIEVNGENQQTIVKGSMGTQPTNIILTKEEIDQILQKFSKASKIPIGEGTTKIILGNLSLSAIISREAGSRFIITKMPLAPPQAPNKMMPRKRFR